MLKVENLSRKFKRGSQEFYAVNDAKLELDYSEFAYIVGRSGSGKTTFLNLVSGILEPTAGSIFFEDKDITKMTDSEKSFYRNETIGFVPQVLGALPNLSVFDNVRVPFFLFNRDGDDKGRAASLLEIMGIEHLKNELPQNLSGGEYKRMLIARAMMNSPKLLIADEPTANLDLETAETVLSFMKEINKQGTAILVVTHDDRILDRNCKVYRMTDGSLSEGNFSE